MMFRAVPSITLILLAAMPSFAGEEDRKGRDERRMLNLEKRAAGMGRPAESEVSGVFLWRETDRLMKRGRAASRDSYQFNRLLEAVDDLLDAREDLAAALHPPRNGDKRQDNRTDTAKRLERAYFRVQQGQYFAKLSGDQQGPEYLRSSRQLYQRARSAFDAGEFARANKLASASSELVNVLENLAQAAVRRPEPPVLEE